MCGCLCTCTYVNMYISPYMYIDRQIQIYALGFPAGASVKNPPANLRDVRDAGFIPELGSSPVGWHDNTLQYSCQENPMDKGAQQATVLCEESDITGVTQHACTYMFQYINISRNTNKKLVTMVIYHEPEMVRKLTFNLHFLILLAYIYYFIIFQFSSVTQ